MTRVRCHLFLGFVGIGVSIVLAACHDPLSNSKARPGDAPTSPLTETSGSPEAVGGGQPLSPAGPYGLSQFQTDRQNEEARDAFSLVILPDTQFYTEQEPGCSNIYGHQAEWIVAKSLELNVRFVVHLGDLTNDNSDKQWAVADAAHAILDRHGIPYSVAVGNHDLLPYSWRRDSGNFNRYFGPWRFASSPWYGGAMAQEANENSVMFFEHRDLKFMVINLEFAPTKNALCWADELVSRNPDRRVIVVTHCYQGRGGHLNCTDRHGIVGSDGENLWDEFISRHSNIFLVLSGHYPGAEYRQRSGLAGNAVHEILTDYQREKPLGSGGSCGNGWLRVLRFLPDEDRVDVRSLTVEEGNAQLFHEPRSPVLYHTAYSPDQAGKDHRYSFSYSMQEPAGTYMRDAGLRHFNDMTVNRTITGEQQNPDIAMDAEGNFVAVWEDSRDGHQGISVRKFCRDGCELLPETLVNTTDRGQRRNPAVAMNATGAFVVVWQDKRDAEGYGVYARGFDAKGKAWPSDLRVDAGAGKGEMTNPAVAVDRQGRFVVVWQEGKNGENLPHVRIRGFFTDGSEWLPEKAVSAAASGRQEKPSVAMNDDGNFIVVWQEKRDGAGHRIYGRGFSGATGDGWTADKALNSGETASYRGNPVVGMDAVGNFVAAWQEGSGGSESDQILARGFDQLGHERLAGMVVNSAGHGRHEQPDIAVNASGDFVVAWQADLDGSSQYQILARGLKSDGSELFHELTVNSEAAGQQTLPAIAAGNGPGFVAVWQDDLDENGYHDILGRGVALSSHRGHPVAK